MLHWYVHHTAPIVWKRLSLQNDLLSWLWDLDSSLLKVQMTNLSNNSYDDNIAWDWEQLLRELAQTKDTRERSCKLTE